MGGRCFRFRWPMSSVSSDETSWTHGVWVSGHPALSEEALVTGVGWRTPLGTSRQEYLALMGFAPGEKLRTPTIGSSRSQTSFCVTSAGSTDH